MGNSIYAGGINIPAHHPNSSSMINSGIHAIENIFYNTSTLFSSTVAIMYTYVQYSSIVNNDIWHTPYSGICLGYGWGMNDVGGSPLYVSFGTYNYQPIFETPTTLMNNVIHGNLIHDYGYSHTDLGSIYTLSKSPSTYITQNYAFNSSWYGVYTDEVSSFCHISGCCDSCVVGLKWLHHPQQLISLARWQGLRLVQPRSNSQPEHGKSHPHR